MLLSSRQIAPPSQWQEFEALCAQLWAVIWQDDNVQRFGRSGQRQNGVDILGRPASGTEGIQCKLKDATTGSALTQREVEREVNEAKKFRPKLTRLIFATTAPPDARLTEKVLQLAEENKKAGLFDIVLFSWTDIVDRLERYPAVAESYCGYAQSILDTRRDVAEIKGAVFGLSGLGEQLAAFVAAVQATPAASPPPIDDILGPQIDRFRDLLRSKYPSLALDLLEQLRSAHWDGASDWTRFRILTNIAAAKAALDRDDAADDFIAAIRYAPDVELALCNVAYGHLLKGEFETAFNKGRAAAERFPDSVSARTLMVAAGTHLPRIADPIELVPEAQRTSAEVAYSVGCFYRTRGDDSARAWFGQAFEKDPDRQEVRIAYAEQLLSDVLGDKFVVLAKQLTPAQQAALRKAEELLQIAWDEVKGTDLAPKFIACATNLSTARRLMKRGSDAMVPLDEALRITPSDDEILLQKAFTAAEMDDLESALSLLTGVRPDAHPGAALFRAEILSKLGRGEEALEAIEAFVSSPEAVNDALFSAERLRVTVISKARGAEAALEAAQRVAAAYQKSILARIMLADSLRDVGSNDAALERAKEAERAAIAPEDRLAVADLLARLNAFEEAASIYAELIPGAVDGPVYRRWVIALFNADLRGAVVEAVRRLPETDQRTLFYLRIMAGVLERAGDLHAAREHYDRYLGLEPADMEMALRRIQLLHRMGLRDAVSAALKRIVIPADIAAVDLMFIAQITAEYGELEEAVRLGYRARRLGFSEPRIHTAYCGLILLQDEKATGFLDIGRVGAEAAFSLRDAAGHETWFVVEPDSPDPRANEIAPSNPIVAACFGKAPGDTVVISETALKRDERTIAAVKHRALHALHETMERFEELFPGAPGMMKMTLEKDAAGQLDLSQMKRVLDANREHVLEIERRYQQGFVPVAVFGRLLGIDPIDAWRGLSAHPSLSPRCCVGTAPERQGAFQLISQRPLWIVDPITLVRMVELGIEDAVTRVAGRVGVCQSSLDLLAQLSTERRESAPRTKGRMGLGDDGRICLVETRPEDLIADADLLLLVHDWAVANCELVPALGAGKVTKQRRERLSTLLADEYYDILLAVDDVGRALLCEDFWFRRLAHEVGRTQGSWLQPILMTAKRRGLLSAEQYVATVVELFRSRHWFTTVAAENLTTALARERYEPSSAFALLARELGRPGVDGLGVASEFMAGLWRSDVPFWKREEITFAFVGALTAEQPRRTVEIVHWLARDMRVRAAALEALRRWCIGHFLSPLPA